LHFFIPKAVVQPAAQRVTANKYKQLGLHLRISKLQVRKTLNQHPDHHMDTFRRPNDLNKPCIRQYAFALLLCLACAFSHAQSSKRVALLIGNSAYSGAMPGLAYPGQDVTTLEPALKRLGFVVQTVRDADQRLMSRAIREFGTAARNAQVAFVYYSGHGMQTRDENFLIPVGAHVETEADLDIEAIPLKALIRQVEEANPAAAVLVLDACRDNPVATRNKSGTKGLSRVQNPPVNSLVVFAALPGTTATDNGVMAQELAKQLAVPNQGVRTIFDKVAQAVRVATASRQSLQREDQLTEDIILLAAAQSTAQATGEQNSAGRQPIADESLAWLDILASPAPWKFLKHQIQFPAGRFAEEARRRAGVAVMTRSGCALREQTVPAPDLEIEWSGGCVDGLADGTGKKTYIRAGVSTLAWTARHERGVPFGSWSGEFLQPGDRKQVEIRFDASGNVQPQQKVVFSSGAVYEGDTDSNASRTLGRPHGAGRMRYADGAVYQGEFVNGLREGSGTLVFPSVESPSSEVRYVGTFKANVADGRGTMEYKDGSRYEGGWVRGRRSGDGKLTQATGTTVEGNWADNHPVQATIRFAPAQSPGAAVRYTGSFKDGKFSGHGTMDYANGGTYTGGWLDGLRHGQGHLSGANGEIYQGGWERDARSGRGDWTLPRSQDPGAMVRYVGEFKNNQPNGQGTIEWANGARYVGLVVNNRPHGYGELRRPDGVVQRGTFDQSRPVSEGPVR
jgi:hypothetical protein